MEQNIKNFIKIPVFETIRQMSEREFKELENKHEHQILEESDGILIVGRFATKRQGTKEKVKS